jgi:DNA-binding transcriptional LysR family regulator
VYRLSRGFCAVWKIACRTAAASTISVEAPKLSPRAAAAYPADPATTVPLSALAGLPFLAPRSNTSCAEMIQRACARAGFVPTIVARATDFAVLLSLVAAGAGVTLVPALAARWLPSQVRLLTPAEPVTRQIFTVSRRGGYRKPAVRVVLDNLAAEAAQLPAALAPAGTDGSCRNQPERWPASQPRGSVAY